MNQILGEHKLNKISKTVTYASYWRGTAQQHESVKFYSCC